MESIAVGQEARRGRSWLLWGLRREVAALRAGLEWSGVSRRRTGGSKGAGLVALGGVRREAAVGTGLEWRGVSCCIDIPGPGCHSNRVTVWEDRQRDLVIQQRIPG